MLHFSKQLKGVVFFILDKHVDRLSSRLCRERVIDLCTREEQRLCTAPLALGAMISTEDGVGEQCSYS